MRRLTDSLVVWRRFWPLISEHRLQFVGIGLASLLAVGVEILRPWPVQWVFDHALAGAAPEGWSRTSIVVLAALSAALIVLLHSQLQYFVEIRTNIVGHAVTRTLRYRIFEHLTKLSPSFHARHKSGDLLVRLMGDVPILRTMLVDSSIALVTRTLLVAGTLGVMLSVDWLLTLVLVSFIPLFLVCVRMMSKRLTAAVRKQRVKEGELADFLHESIAATPLIQSLGRSDDTVRRFARSNRTSVRAGLKAARLSARMGATVESLLGTSLALALGLGCWRVIEGHLSPGELLVFLSYVRGLLKPVRAASKHAERVARGSACSERILVILDEKVDIVSPPDARPAPVAPQRLVFDQVAFGYGGKGRGLVDFSAEFRRGELTGIFGRSGSGKSTFAALALRLFEPRAGSVRIDDVDLRSMDLDSLRASFGLCMQDSVLFGDTLRENLLLGRPDATDAELFVACQQAAFDPVLARLPEGLDTRLGTAGSGLSGGERRRLCLARTLLRRAPVLIVDEPFAGLDRPSAIAVRESLRALARDRITIVIAHDVEHLDAFDRILFVEKGRVRASGTHDELTAHDDAYRNVTRSAALTAR